jgi:spore coat protein U-like protein
MIKQSQMTRQRAQVALLALLATAGLAMPRTSLAATATASSSSTVVVPIAISKTADLAFGKFAAVTGGTVTVSTSGARTVTGTVVAMASTSTAAKFDVTGEAGATYSISLPATSTLNSGSDSITFDVVSDLTGTNSTSGTVSSGTLAGGAQSIYVGGTLTVASGQAPGTYTGTVAATVEYN